MQTSLSDIASRAGVSTATVSRVLNDKALGRIPEATRVRIKQVALELDYQPNRFAQGLQSRRTKNIGLLFHGLRNPFFAEMFDTLEQLIVDAGYHVLPDTGRRADGPDATGLKGWPVDGVLMWAMPRQKINAEDQQGDQKIPIVYMGYVRSDSADYVAHDSLEGARVALEHLWDRGHRRIALAALIDRKAYMPENRIVAYELFCQEKDIAPIRLELGRTETVNGPRQDAYRRLGYEAGCLLGVTPIGSRPSAVFCHNDLTALGLINGALARGLRVPEDVAVVGFDGIEEGKYQARPLTTAVVPAKQICALALETLLRRISGDLPADPQQIVLPMTLRIGETT